MVMYVGVFNDELERLVICFNGYVTTHNILLEFCTPVYHSQKLFFDSGVILLGGCQCH